MGKEKYTCCVGLCLQLSKQSYPKKRGTEILSRMHFKVIKMSTYKKKNKKQ